MPAKGVGSRSSRVFLNVPYDDPSYERILVALTAALVAIRRVPCLTLEIPDRGDGRLKKIFVLVKSCRVSIHDLSAVDVPVRFNMPFELGMAWAFKQQNGSHDLLVLEKEAYRLDKTLSDLRGIDPKIHKGSPKGAICAILESLEKRGGNPSAEEVLKLYRKMWRVLPKLKETYGIGFRGLFSKSVYENLVTKGNIILDEMARDGA